MRQILFFIKRFIMKKVVLIFFSCILTFLIVACNGNSNSDDDDTSVDDDYYPDDDYVPDDDMISDDDSGDDDTIDDDFSNDDAVDDDSLDDDAIDDDSNNDDINDDDIVYGPGDIVFGYDISDEGYLCVLSNQNRGNILNTKNNMNKLKSKTDRYDFSMTVIPSSKSGFAFDKIFLGDNINSIRVAHDSLGNLYYTYLDDRDSHHILHLVNNAQGTWTDEIIIEMDQTIYGCLNLVLDGNNRAHIVYQDWDSKIIYATNANGNWAFENVVNQGFLPTLAIDSQGYAHIAFLGLPLGIASFYATNKSGSWVTELVQIALPQLPCLDFLGRPAIAIDYNNKPNICNTHLVYTPYIAICGSYIYCGEQNNGTWDMNLVLGYTGILIGWPKLLIDQQNDLHLIYDEGNNIIHAFNSSGPFSQEIVYEGSGIDSLTTTLDDYDNIHIIFLTMNTYYIGYSTNASGEWVTTILGPL